MVKPYFEKNDVFTMPESGNISFLKGKENLCLTATSKKLQFFLF